MFSLCPHCQFLLARDPRSGRLPATCPKCGGEVVDEAPPPAAAPATATEAPSSDDQAAPAEPAPPAHHARRPRRRRAAEDAGSDAPAAPDTAEAASRSPEAAAAGTGDADTGTPVDAGAAVESPVQPNADATPDSSGEPMPPPDPGQDPAHDPAPADDTAAGPAGDAAARAHGVAPQTPDLDDAPAAAVARRAESAAATDAAPAATGAGPPAAPPPRPAPPRAPRPPAPHGRRLPSFLQARHPVAHGTSREATILWPAIGLLALVLLVQLLLADRARLAMDAGWRPTLVRMCGVFGCTLPPWREPQAFTMLSRDVRAHPQRPGTLRVTASFRNDARWPQPWPVLLLSLSDLDGRVAGARAFAPDEYVEADARDRLLEPGQVATVTLDVVEPSPRIVAFTFDFR